MNLTAERPLYLPTAAVRNFACETSDFARPNFTLSSPLHASCRHAKSYSCSCSCSSWPSPWQNQTGGAGPGRGRASKIKTWRLTRGRRGGKRDVNKKVRMNEVSTVHNLPLSVFSLFNIVTFKNDPCASTATIRLKELNCH